MSGGLDLEKLRGAPRRMSRGSLGSSPSGRHSSRRGRSGGRARGGESVRPDDEPIELAETRSGPAPLLDEIRQFHGARLRREVCESFNVNGVNLHGPAPSTLTASCLCR